MNTLFQLSHVIRALLPGLALTCATAQAAAVISGVTATATSSWNTTTLAPVHLVDNSGLSAPYGITSTHAAATDAGGGNFWHTATGDPTPTLTFALNVAYDLENIYIWNGNQGYAGQNVTDRGVQQFDVLVSTDGTNFTEVLSNQTLTRSPYYSAGNGTDGYLDRIPAQSFSLAGQNGITHVRIKVDSNYGSAYTSLSEVIFTGTALTPQLAAPAALDFGDVSVAQTPEKDITLSNTGGATLNVTGVAVTGADLDYFTVAGFPATINAGTTAPITVKFNPKALNPAGDFGPFSATLEITSDTRGTAGTVTAISLAAEVVDDPLLTAPAAHVFKPTVPGSSTPDTITLTNNGPATPLSITNIEITGTNAAAFAVNLEAGDYPVQIAPIGGTRLIPVTFTPTTGQGAYSATLEITSNHAGAPGTVTTIDLTGRADHLAVLSAPTITAVATPFNNTYLAGNLFDGRPTEYSCKALGVGDPFSRTNGTWLELDFGQNVTLDRMILVTRPFTTDTVIASRLILSNDTTFDATDTIHTFDPTGANAQGLIHSFPPTTARYARWEVVSKSPVGVNLGGMELRFLDSRSGFHPVPVTITAAADAKTPDQAMANAANGDAGRSAGSEYASGGFGADMFVDFDLGASMPIVGFDFFDRLAQADRVLAFNLLFSDDPTFATGVTTLSFAPGSDGWGFRESFAAVTARYIRLDATETFSEFNDAGMQEIIFYSSISPKTPFERWIADEYPSLTGGDALPGTDPDGDGLNNIGEFAFKGDPTNGADKGHIAPTVTDTNGNAQRELTLTVAIRAGAVFTGTPSPSATVDGILYTLQGSLDLADSFQSAVSEVIPALTPAQSGLPDLTGSGWRYHTFRLDASEGLPDKGFLRATASQP